MNKPCQILILLALLAPAFTQIIIPLEPVPKGKSHPNVRVLDSTTFSLQNFANYQYLAYINIGTPSQGFRMVFDTYYADTVVFGSGCTNCVNKTHFYSANTSSTSHDTKLETDFDYFYPEHLSQCEVYSDVINIANYEISDAEFLVSEDGDGGISFDGLFGLGYVSSINSSVTPFAKLLDQQNLPRVFSIYYSQNTDAPGSITLGGYDNSLTSHEFTYHNVSTNNTWELSLDDFGLGDTSYSNNATGLKVVLISALPYIVGNTHVVSSLLNSTDFPRNGDCSDLSSIPDLYFTIGGVKYQIPANITYSAFTQNCSRMFADNVEYGNITMPNGTIYLGVPFLTTFYTTFDMENQRVGLTQSPAVPPKPLAGSRLGNIMASICFLLSIMHLVL